MFRSKTFNPFRDAAFQARMEYACFEATLKKAIQVTLAEVVGVCLPKGSRVAELDWQSVRYSPFDDGNKEID